MKRRTEFDFSKHKHRVEIFKCGEKKIRVDHFQKEDSRMGYVKFVNTNDTLTVSGDFGNYVFCRPFVPSKDGFVSEMYWLEKLKMYSNQMFDELDFTSIIEDIKEKINGGLEEYGYKDKELEEATEWYNELLDVAESEDNLDYTHKTYRDYHKPNFIDYDDIPYYKLLPEQLKIVFDVFDIICSRLKEEK